MKGPVSTLRAVETTIVAAVAGYGILLIGFPGAFDHGFLASHFLYRDKHLFSPGHTLRFAPLALSLAFLLLCVARGRNKRYLAGLLFLCGVALQWSFSFLDSGVNAERMTSTSIDERYGHSEFAFIARFEKHPLIVARDYEAVCKYDDRVILVKSKPPGHLLFYILWGNAYRLLRLDGLFNRLSGPLHFYAREPITAFGGFLALVFSLFSNLPVFFLWKIGTLLGNRRVALCLCLAFLLCPSIQLVTMHLDEVLYPSLVALTLLFTLLSILRNPYYAFLAALALYASIYTSFSLLFLIPTILLWGGGFFLLRKDLRSNAVRALLFGAAGLAVSHLAFALLLNFDLPGAYRRSMENHIAWRNTPGLIGPAFTTRNFLEMARWIGLPAVVVYLWCCCAIARRFLRSRRMSPLDPFVILYPVLLAAVSTFGHTIAEVGRLWIPMMVPMFVAVALRLDTLYKKRVAWVYIVSAFVMVLLVKDFHDFR